MSTCQWPSKGKIKCTYKVSDEVPNQGLQEKLCKAEQDYFGAPGIGWDFSQIEDLRSPKKTK